MVSHKTIGRPHIWHSTSSPSPALTFLATGHLLLLFGIHAYQLPGSIRHDFTQCEFVLLWIDVIYAHHHELGDSLGRDGAAWLACRWFLFSWLGCCVFCVCRLCHIFSVIWVKKSFNVCTAYSVFLPLSTLLESSHRWCREHLNECGGQLYSSNCENTGKIILKCSLTDYRRIQILYTAANPPEPENSANRINGKIDADRNHPASPLHLHSDNGFNVCGAVPIGIVHHACAEAKPIPARLLFRLYW